MAPEAVVDANILVALVDKRDTWHPQAIALRDALLAGQARLIYFDCVVDPAQVQAVVHSGEQQDYGSMGASA